MKSIDDAALLFSGLTSIITLIERVVVSVTRAAIDGHREGDGPQIPRLPLPVGEDDAGRRQKRDAD